DGPEVSLRTSLDCVKDSVPRTAAHSLPAHGSSVTGPLSKGRAVKATLGTSAFAAEEPCSSRRFHLLGCSGIHEVCTPFAPCSHPFPVTVSTSAYPLAFPEALASWRLPPCDPGG